MSYCPKCKKTGGCTHTDRQFPYSLPAEMARLERALNVEREAHARTLAALAALFSFPGVSELLADRNSLGSIRAQVETALAAAKVTP